MTDDTPDRPEVERPQCTHWHLHPLMYPIRCERPAGHDGWHQVGSESWNDAAGEYASMTGATYLCGGDTRPGPRDECPDPLHDYPLPSGYVDAAETASRRLARGWANVRCRSCGLYGWRPGRPLGDGSDGPVAS